MIIVPIKDLPNIAALIFMFFCITGCEGYTCANGTVKDGETNLPLDSVRIFIYDVSEISYTDSTGNFSGCGEFGSCMSGCKDVKIEFSKRGYKTKTVKNPDAGMAILLDRQ